MTVGFAQFWKRKFPDGSLLVDRSQYLNNRSTRRSLIISKKAQPQKHKAGLVGGVSVPTASAPLRRLVCLMFLIASPVFIAWSCSNSQTTAKPETAAFKKNQQLWQSKNIVSYRYTLKERCYCPLQYLGPNRIEVRDGKTRSINYIGESKNIDMKDVKLPDTIEKLFEIASGLDDEAVVYDSTYGFPKSISLYGPKGTQDTSSFYVVRDFEVVK